MSPGRERRRTIEGAPSERLLSAATDLFTRRGYAATSVREIVELAGVTKPVLYYHFGSKEGIYRALAEQLFAEFESRLGGARDHRGSTLERVTAICSDLFQFVEERRETVRLFYAIYFGPAQSGPAFDLDEFVRRFRQEIESTLRGGVAAGEIGRARIRDVAIIIEAILNNAVEATLFEPDRSFSPKHFARLIELVFNGAAAGAAKPKSRKRRRSAPRKEIPA